MNQKTDPSYYASTSSAIIIPKPVGYWLIGDNKDVKPFHSNFCISVYRKPNWLHIKMMKILLGIKYHGESL